jgi:hypothetical protein
VTYAIVLASSLLAVVLALALAREVRLRRALERLLARILSYWRNQHASNETPAPHDAGADRDLADRDRLR